MADPGGPDTAPKQVLSRGEKQEEYSELNEEKTDMMKLTHNTAIRLKGILKIEIATQEKNKEIFLFALLSMWLKNVMASVIICPLLQSQRMSVSLT